MDVTDFNGTNARTVIGAIISAGQCRTFCNPGTYSFTTDLNKTDDLLPLVFNSYPTLFHDYIRFSTSNTIKKIELYDVKGKKVLVKPK